MQGEVTKVRAKVRMASKTRTFALPDIKNKIRRSALYKQEKLRKNKEKRIKNFKRKQQEADGQEEVKRLVVDKPFQLEHVFRVRETLI